MPNQIPAEYIRVFAQHVRAFGKVTLSEEKMMAVFQMAGDAIAMRRTLERIAANGATNHDMQRWAQVTLRDRPPLPHIKRRLVTLEATHA